MFESPFGEWEGESRDSILRVGRRRSIFRSVSWEATVKIPFGMLRSTKASTYMLLLWEILLERLVICRSPELENNKCKLADSDGCGTEMCDAG